MLKYLLVNMETKKVLRHEKLLNILSFTGNESEDDAVITITLADCTYPHTRGSQNVL